MVPVLDSTKTKNIHTLTYKPNTAILNSIEVYKDCRLITIGFRICCVGTIYISINQSRGIVTNCDFNIWSIQIKQRFDWIVKRCEMEKGTIFSLPKTHIYSSSIQFSHYFSIVKHAQLGLFGHTVAAKFAGTKAVTLGALPYHNLFKCF